MPPYVPLWVKSNHSFLEGASFPEELLDTAQALELDTIAITDRDGMYGLVRAHVRAKELGIRLIAGTQFTVGQQDKDPTLPILALARSQKGYASLCRLLSKGHTRCEKGLARVELPEICELTDVFVLCPTPEPLFELKDRLGDSLFALCTRHFEANDRTKERALTAAAEHLQVPLVGAVEVLYHDRARRPLQDIVACIRAGCELTQAGLVIRPNAEHALKPASEMQALFKDRPAWLTRTREIAEQCVFSLDDIHYRYPAERLPSGQTEHSWLRQLTFEGARWRYKGSVPSAVRRQLKRELTIIEQLEYGGYFLTMYEIVQYCRAHHILCQGRGSAANSAVCFCLGITAIDPVRMNLLFERFMSLERAEPPDIDLDIEHDRREEVIQHVYQKYGRRHAAMVANVIRYRVRSAVRDVGKVLGIPRTDLDAATRLLRHRDDMLNQELLTEAGLCPDTPATSHVLGLASQILDFPRHLSIHPGGFLLGDCPVDELVPIEPATMEDRTVIQWDKYDVDNLALFKVDLLGLGSLTCIHHAFDLLSEHDHVDLEIATVPAEDEATYKMVTAADTVGVFQIESRAQMSMLPRLKPKTFYDLVIEVAIVRPGPIQGDMVHPYLRRRSGEEPIEYPHPKLEGILKKTLGVPIFQEQVMKLAVEAAGYTAGEADQLRRDMAAWRRSGVIERHRDRMTSQMIENGIPQEFAERIFSQIRGFGEYGFPESHAASFALLAYVTAWLKCHHPAVFLCAMLNAQPMGFYSPATLVEDAKRHGVTVLPIDVNHSQWDCTIDVERGHAVRMGLRYVKGFGKPEQARFIASPGPYAGLQSLAHATKLNRRSLLALAECGAFESFGFNRRNAIWQVRALGEFSGTSLRLSAPASQTSFASLCEDDRVVWDYRASHHSTRGHPMRRFRKQLSEMSVPRASDVIELPHGTQTDYVGMVICRQRPGTASGVTFFTLEDETGFVNLVVWRDTFDRFATIAKTASLLGVTGHIQAAHGTTHLIARSLWLPGGQAPSIISREFQ